MDHRWSLSLQRLFALVIFSGIALLSEGSGAKFDRLDSTFRANAGIYSQEELKDLLFDLRALARGPEDQGKLELCNSIFHLRGSRLGLALIANQKAERLFDSIGDSELLLRARMNAVDIFVKRRDRKSIDETMAQILQTPRAGREDKVAVQILRMRGATHLQHGNSDSAHHYLEKANEMALGLGDSTESVRALYLDAIAYQLQGKPKRALQTMLDIEPGIFTVPDFTLQVNYYNILGMVYMSVGQNENAVFSYEKGVEIAQKRGLRYEEGILLSSLAIGQKASGDTTEAIASYEAALEISMELDLLSTMSSICSGLADIHIGLKNWDLAGEFAQRGLDYSREAQITRMETYALMRVAMVKMQQGGYEAALDALSQADSLTRPSGNWTRVKDINELRAEASEQLGEMEQALAFQRMAAAAQDSIEFLEAKKYADSLMLTQPVIVSNAEGEGASGGGPWIWLAGLLGLLGLSGFLYWKLRSRSEGGAAPSTREKVQEEPDPESIREAIRALKEDKDWTRFMLQFDSIYPGLMSTVGQRHAKLTPTDMRILALARLGLSVDESADLLGISSDSVKKARYRTRKRMGLPADQTLMQYMLQG